MSAHTRSVLSPSRHVVYGLRFHILPDQDAAGRARDLGAFCRAHGIEEVHLFVAPEEWNDGLLDRAQIETSLEGMRQVLPILRQAGLKTSLNLWATTLHTDRGRRFKPEHHFQPMVSPRGMAAKSVASFACPNWQRYVADLYGAFAALGFDVLWIEDDFRYHNHDPLDWGGTFDPLMLERFSRRIGRPVTLQEVVEAILQPGLPHPWRAEWQAVWFAAQHETMQGIRQAVEAACPSAALGLMSSTPEAHSLEGRDWQGLFQAMDIGGRVFHRPHFTTYSETQGPELINAAAMLDVQRAFRPGHARVYPEIENFPFGPFVKSDTCTFAQMAMCMILGSDGLLLDLNSMTGASIDTEPYVGELLDASWPGLDWLAGTFDAAMETHGVGVPWRSDAASRLRTSLGESMAELQVSPLPPARILGSFNIAFQMRPGRVNALWGPFAWTFSDEEIRQFLKGGLWLDAEAAEILIARGFGSDIGLAGITRQGREDSNYSMERVDSVGSGVPLGLRLSANGFSSSALLMPDSQTETWTSWLNARGERLGTCLSVFRNAMDGMVAVNGYDLFREERSLFKNFHRLRMVQSLIRRLSGGKPPVMVEGGPYLVPMDLGHPGQRDRRVVVWNMAHDSARPVLRLSGETVHQATLIRPLSEPQEVGFQRIGEGAFELGEELPYYGMAVFSV